MEKSLLDGVAIGTLLVLIPLFLWAWRKVPGRVAQQQFYSMWSIVPWGRQVIVDFFALEVVLALWMIADASMHGSWLLLVLCLAAMPVFGAIPAALYWLLRVAG